jgi:hypothetical protein
MDPTGCGEQLEAFDEPGVVTVHGLLRRPQTQTTSAGCRTLPWQPGNQAASLVDCQRGRLQLQMSDRLLAGLHC